MHKHLLSLMAAATADRHETKHVRRGTGTKYASLTHPLVTKRHIRHDSKIRTVANSSFIHSAVTPAFHVVSLLQLVRAFMPRTERSRGSPCLMRGAHVYSCTDNTRSLKSYSIHHMCAIAPKQNEQFDVLHRSGAQRAGRKSGDPTCPHSMLLRHFEGPAPRGKSGPGQAPRGPSPTRRLNIRVSNSIQTLQKHFMVLCDGCSHCKRHGNP